MTTARYEEVLKLVEELTPDERRQLVERLNAMADEPVTLPKKRTRWTDLIGTAPYPALGEDAQQWVTRTRRESDEAREAQWRRE